MRPTHPRQILNAAGTETFLVTNLVNIRYVTGLTFSAGALFVRPRFMALYVDGRYKEVAEKKVPEGVRVRDLTSLPKALDTCGQCGFESQEVTVDQLRNWKRKFKNTKFVQKAGIIEEFRRSKEPDELKKFRRAKAITEQMIERIPTVLKSGITERGVAWHLEVWARELGAEELSFDPIVAFGTHSSRPHHHPTDRKLKKGSIVQIDCGAKYQGYCADQSAVFFTGKKTDQQKRVYQAVKEAKDAAIAAVKPGVLGKELDAIARKVLKKHGYEKYFAHALGHGVGLEIHEGVVLSAKAKEQPLLKNEIITIEPGVYIPGKFGMRLEEEIVVR